MKLRYIFSAIYLCMWTLTYTNMLARDDILIAPFEYRDANYACRYKHGAAAVLGLLPPFWIANAAFGGLYADGFSWSCK